VINETFLDAVDEVGTPQFQEKYSARSGSAHLIIQALGRPARGTGQDPVSKKKRKR
jgi:hypothetical protein